MLRLGDGAKVRLSRIRSPQGAVALVCGCVLIHLAALNYDVWRPDAKHARSDARQWTAKYEPLGPLLPAGQPVRFVVDEAHADLKVQHPDARWYLAQYAVSPKRLLRGVECRWVVVDSDSPKIPPAVAENWTLEADLHNGVRLYRVEARK